MRYLSSFREASLRSLEVTCQDPGFCIFNPCVTVVNDRIVSSFRAANFQQCERTGRFYFLPPHKEMKNEIIFGELSEDFTLKRQIDVDLKAQASVAAAGLEDLRIVASPDGTIEGMAAVPSPDSQNTPDGARVFGKNASTKMARVQFGPEFEITRLTTYESPFKRRTEKNWSPFFHEGKFCVIYQWNPLIILELLPDGAVRFLKWFEFSDQFKSARGSSQGLETKNGFLFVVHQKYKLGGKDRFTHRLIELGRDLQPLRLSEDFGLISSGLLEYCLGLARFKNRYLLSFGLNDRLPFLMDVEEEFLDRLLLPLAAPILENKSVPAAPDQATALLATVEFPHEIPLTFMQRLKRKGKKLLGVPS